MKPLILRPNRGSFNLDLLMFPKFVPSKRDLLSQGTRGGTRLNLDFKGKKMPKKKIFHSSIIFSLILAEGLEDFLPRRNVSIPSSNV